MKTQVMTFKINKPYEHWEKNFDSHKEAQASAGMTPLYRDVLKVIRKRSV